MEDKNTELNRGLEDRKKINKIVGIVAGIVVVGIIIAVIIGIMTSVSKTDILDAYEDAYNSEGLEIVEVGSVADEKKIESIILENEFINKYFNIEIKESNSMTRLDTGLRVMGSTIYDGTAKDGSTNKISITTTPGLGSSPSVTFTVSAKDISEDEINTGVQGIIKEIFGEDVASIVNRTDYNETDVVVSGERQISVNRTKMENEGTTLTEEMFSGMSEEEKSETFKYLGLEEGTELPYEIKGDTLYTTSVSYIATSEDVSSTYEYTDYDKRLINTIPIIRDSGTDDISYSLCATKLNDLIGADRSEVQVYSVENGEKEQYTNMSIMSYMESGEGVETTFSMTYSNETKTTDYSFTNVTGYMESENEVKEKAIEVINGITKLSINEGRLIKVSEDGEWETLYSYTSDEISVTISIKNEEGLGYYGYITAY